MADWRIIMKKEETKIVDLYDLSHTQAADFLRQFTYPWEALAHIKEFILELGKTLPEGEYERRGETVWVHKTARVMPSAFLWREYHYRKGHRGPPLRVPPGKCLSRRGSRRWKLHGVKKCDPVR